MEENIQAANTCIKRCSTSGKEKLKQKIFCLKKKKDILLTHTRMDKIQILSVNEDVEQLEFLDIVDSCANWLRYFLKHFDSIKKKLNIYLLYYPANPHLNIYPKEAFAYFN